MTEVQIHNTIILKLGSSCNEYMKSFIAKRIISILVNLRYLRFKLLKYKENNKRICNTFDHNFKNIPLYIMSNVSLERYYFVLYDGALTLNMSKMALHAFCDKTLHMGTQEATGNTGIWAMPPGLVDLSEMGKIKFTSKRLGQIVVTGFPCKDPLGLYFRMSGFKLYIYKRSLERLMHSHMLV